MHFDPSLFGKTLAVLRVLRGWTQKQLAAACQLKSDTISDLERSPDSLTLGQLQRFAAVMDQPSFLLNVVLWLVRLHRRLMGAVAGGEPPRPGLATEAERIGEILDRFYQGGEGAQLMALAELKTELREREGRRQAAELWEVLEPLEPAERRLLAKARLFQKPALVVLLCQQSIELAAHEADLAVAAAELALELAAKVPGDEKARWRLQGYAGFHHGNALKVRNDLAGARAAFLKADSLWERGQPGEPGFLDEARVLGLKAGLLRIEQRFAEAVELLDQALALPSLQERPYLLISRGRMLAELDDHQGALAYFEKAFDLLSTRVEDSRLLLVALGNQVFSLCELGQYGEATLLLATLHQRKGSLGDLDFLELQLLEGRVAVGLGRLPEAYQTFTQVRSELRRRNLVYNEAIVILELANLHLQEGHWAQVESLSRQLSHFFSSNAIHREALAALVLFCKAATARTLTPALGRRLLKFLECSRHRPDLSLTEFLQ